MKSSLDIVVVGLAFTSSWGNGHATTFRSLIKGLHARGHRVTFLEQNQPWYAAHRDLPSCGYCTAELYTDVHDLRRRFARVIAHADAVLVGSFVSNGAEVCAWVLDTARGVRAFYDIDTPITLARLRDGACEYLRREQISAFDLVLSFTGGPVLAQLTNELRARRVAAFYCSVDPDAYRPMDAVPIYDLGYMGTYSADRQILLTELLLDAASTLPRYRFAVVGAQYPTDIDWPTNVARREHLSPAEHAAFYGSQRFTLNLTRADMRRLGYSPSVRLFEAAACAVPIVTDEWPGLHELFARDEILIARERDDVVHYLQDVAEAERSRIARRARERVLALHTGARRAQELERLLQRASVAVPRVGAIG